LISSISFGQNNKDLDIDYMLRGHMYANSSIIDSTALGGYRKSGNQAKSVQNQFSTKKGVFLKIDTTEVVTINKENNGYHFYIGNKSDSILKLSASDSRFYVIAEVFYENKWQAIEYLPSSWCGNSYHIVYLNPNEYWEFEIPKFKGNINSKLRYRLMIENNVYKYSNEITISFNKGQLSQKEGHNRNGIMDPYND
jgi:hypothetical protein